MIRQAVSSDAEAIAALMTELGYPTSADAMSSRLAALSESEAATFVSDADARIDGVIGLMLHRYYELDGLGAQVAVLVVTASARGKGVGRLLIEAGEDWARTHGAQLMWLGTAPKREGAQRFYKAAGFHQTGIRFSKELRA
jgi:GNAT superfamily N-acetyltransferase